MAGASAVLAAVTCAGAGVAAADEPFACPAPSTDAPAAERLARRLFEDAVSREPADPEGALDRLRCAQEHAARPAIALRIGTIAERLGKDREAVVAFESYLALAGRDAPDAEPMRAHIEQLRAKLPPERPQPAREVGVPVPGRLAPGQGGATLQLVGWVAAGAGAATALAGGVLLFDARLTSDDVHDIPSGTTKWVSDEARGRYETAQVEQTVGIIAVCVGAAIAAGGIFVALRARPSAAGPARRVGTAIHPARRGAAAALSLRF